MCVDIRPDPEILCEWGLVCARLLPNPALNCHTVVFLSDTPREPGPTLSQYCDSNYRPLFTRLAPSLSPALMTMHNNI